MARTDVQDLRAADYVLGLMEPKEAVFFERDMRRDPELAGRVETWRRLAAGIDASEDPTPHAEMRRLIEAGLERRQAASPPLPRRRVRIAFAVAGAAMAFLIVLLWRLATG